MANDAKVSKNVAKRIQEQKQEILEFLAETPIRASACRKSGVSHATYYRWLDEDSEFAKQADKALVQGRAFRCEMAESGLFAKVAEKDWPAIKYLLEHNHPIYMLAPKVPAPNWREERIRRGQEELNESTVSHPTDLESQKKNLGRRYEEELRNLIIGERKSPLPDAPQLGVSTLPTDKTPQNDPSIPLLPGTK